MRIKTTDPKELWRLYSEGQTYNERINLYHTVEVNEQFYAGDQWHGLCAPDIDKPIVNIIRQPINYMTATIVSDDIVIDLSPSLPSSEDEAYLDSVKSEVERVREQIDMESLSRDSIRKAAIDADACMYFWWDSSVKTGQERDGDIRAHLVENTNCQFGNPSCKDPQKQPYIQVVIRDYIEDVIDEAVNEGMDETEARRLITPDDGGNHEQQEFDKLVTKLVTFYKREGTVHAVISTQRAIIRKEWDTKLTLYPVAWYNWQPSRSSYHGVSIVTEMVPTQIYVNKMVANYMRVVSLYAWPKIIYKRSLFPNGWNSRIGVNIGVDGNPADAYAAIFPGAGATQDVVQCLDWIMGRIKEASGANDASLGQIKSDNTSAIIAAQEANTIPLDLIQRGFYAFQEQTVRIIIDMLRAYAGSRKVPLTKKEQEAQKAMDYAAAQPMGGGLEETMAAGQTMPAELSSPLLDSPELTATAKGGIPDGIKVIDFGRLGDIAWKLKVDIGEGSFFSEAIRSTTLSNLVQMGLMNQLDYYKRVPDKYVPNKQEIIERLEQEQEMQPPMGGEEALETAIPPEGAPTLDDASSVARAKNFIMGRRQGL